MSENTAKTIRDSEPQDHDGSAPQKPAMSPAIVDKNDSPEKSISAEAIVSAPPTAEINETAVARESNHKETLATEPGQFRTKPMDMNLSFGAPPHQQPNLPQTMAYATPAYAPQKPPQPTPHYAQSFARTQSHQPGMNPAPGQNLPGAGAPAPSLPGQSYTQQFPQRYEPNPGVPQAHKPRRKAAENITYGPATGKLPLSKTEGTEVPSEGPIKWPRRPTGFVGVANLVLSAVMTVIWAWFPIGLIVTGIGGVFALGLGALVLLVWVIVQQGVNSFERYRAELVYGDKIPVPAIERSTHPQGFTRFLLNMWLQVKSGAFWRSTVHHFVKMLFGAVIVAGTLGASCVAIFGIFAAINPDGISPLIGDTGSLPGRLGLAIGAIIILASSAAILWFAPLIDRALDRSLLTPPRTAVLQAEVTELDKARVAGIDAAAAERQRIERDLHDGAQPRLVALTMTLGMAKTKIDNDPERAKELISEAHAEAKGIVTELRQLARGIHPAVLTDRGLDAAVSALAGRSPIPVEVDVRLSGRIDREAEAVAYFVVAECLTNIAKHSGATHAKVFIMPIEAGVQVVVTDNGHGGARIDRSGAHTGIAGLVDRVEAARGTLNLTSPAGGPTTVAVEVPCAS